MLRHVRTQTLLNLKNCKIRFSDFNFFVAKPLVTAELSDPLFKYRKHTVDKRTAQSDLSSF